MFYFGLANSWELRLKECRTIYSGCVQAFNEGTVYICMERLGGFEVGNSELAHEPRRHLGTIGSRPAMLYI